MSKMTLAERVSILRQAAAQGRKNPASLFDARMSVHNAVSGMGCSTSEICRLLLPQTPPLSEWDCIRMEMLAERIEANDPWADLTVLEWSDMIALMTP